MINIKISKTQRNKILTVLAIMTSLAFLFYLALYVFNLLNPVYDNKPISSDIIELKNNEIQIIQDINKINTYLLQPTVSPGELGRTNPFAPL